MASANLTLTAGQWVEIPSSLSLVLKHRTGGPVVYAVSESEPIAFGASTPITQSTSIGQEVRIGGVGIPVWAQAISTDAAISYTEVTDSTAAILQYSELKEPGINAFTQSFAEVQTARGRRYTHKFDLTFSGSETKYYFYRFPVASGKILAVQERILRSKDGEATLEVLPSSSGYTLTTQDAKIQKANNVITNTPILEVYNLTDGTGNVEPSTDGPILDTDFVSGTGGGSNRAGSFSPQSGTRLFPSAAIAVKVTNEENSNNRISLEYSWFELDDDFIQ